MAYARILVLMVHTLLVIDCAHVTTAIVINNVIILLAALTRPILRCRVAYAVKGAALKNSLRIRRRIVTRATTRYIMSLFGIAI